MEPEGSLPHSRVLATCPYSEHFYLTITKFTFRYMAYFKEWKSASTKASRNVEFR